MVHRREKVTQRCQKYEQLLRSNNDNKKIKQSAVDKNQRILEQMTATAISVDAEILRLQKLIEQFDCT